MLPTPLTLIPTSVLDGLFLFMAITSLDGNQMFERALLLVTEQVWSWVLKQTTLCRFPSNDWANNLIICKAAAPLVGDNRIFNEPLLYLLTQICFLIASECVMGHGSKLINSLGQPKIANTLRKKTWVCNSHVIRSYSWNGWHQPNKFFQFYFYFWVGRYNKTLDDWHHGKQWVLFPLNPNVPLGFPLRNIEGFGETKLTVFVGATHKELIDSSKRLLFVDSLPSLVLIDQPFWISHMLKYFSFSAWETYRTNIDKK